MTSVLHASDLAARLGLGEGVEGTALAAPRDVLDIVRSGCPGATLEYKPLAGVYQLRPSSFLWCFCSLDAEVKRALPALRRGLRDTGALWVSWPRKRSWSAIGMRPELGITAEAVLGYAAPLGLVPEDPEAGVLALDESWSALKLVVRAPAGSGASARPTA